MRAVSSGRVAVQDMDTDHGHLCVAMAEKFLDRADIVAPSSGCVTDKWPLWVRSRTADDPAPMSAVGRGADMTGSEADVQGVGSAGFQTDALPSDRRFRAAAA